MTPSSEFLAEAAQSTTARPAARVVLLRSCSTTHLPVARDRTFLLMHLNSENSKNENFNPYHTYHTCSSIGVLRISFVYWTVFPNFSGSSSASPAPPCAPPSSPCFLASQHPYFPLYPRQVHRRCFVFFFFSSGWTGDRRLIRADHRHRNQHRPASRSSSNAP